MVTMSLKLYEAEVVARKLLGSDVRVYADAVVIVDVAKKIIKQLKNPKKILLLKKMFNLFLSGLDMDISTPYKIGGVKK